MKMTEKGTNLPADDHNNIFSLIRKESQVY